MLLSWCKGSGERCLLAGLDGRSRREEPVASVVFVVVRVVGATSRDCSVLEEDVRDFRDRVGAAERTGAESAARVAAVVLARLGLGGKERVMQKGGPQRRGTETETQLY